MLKAVRKKRAYEDIVKQIRNLVEKGRWKRGDQLPTERELSELLLAGVTALAGAGEVEAACRLSGRACVALRGTDPAAARRFDVLLHRLTRKLKW